MYTKNKINVIVPTDCDSLFTVGNIQQIPDNFGANLSKLRFSTYNRVSRRHKKVQ